MLDKNQITKSQSRFIVASTASESGKTTLTLGLLRALENRGKIVQTFKCGPDLVDNKYFELTAKKNSYNLDTFIQSESHVKSLYTKYSVDADVCITEGYKALFDGYENIVGSTAQIAELTHTPVILVVDTSRESYSVAAQVYGYLNFRKSIKILGVVLNFVKNEEHLQILKDACAEFNITVLGHLFQDELLHISLQKCIGETVMNQLPFDEYVNKLANVVEETIDIDSILRLTTKDMTYDVPEVKPVIEQTFTIAVAHDKAFCFYYNENLQRFREKANVIFFSPINDKQLPEADFVYLPSGFSEYYLKELSDNISMKDSMREYIEQGGYLLAECGGMLYLSDAVIGNDGTRYPMVGIFNQEGSFQNKKAVTGYRIVNFKDRDFRGYEHHNSHLLTTDAKHSTDTPVLDVKGNRVPSHFFRYKNTIVGYTHIYWAERGLIELFLLLLEESPMYDY